MRETAAYTWIEQLVYSTVSGIRFTQRSPIMPDVWIRYGMDGPGAQDLLLMANWSDSGVALADRLEARLGEGRSDDATDNALMDAQIAPTQSAVAARLTFAELMRSALPLSPWWHRYLVQEDEPSRFFADSSAFAPLRQVLRAGLTGGRLHMNAPAGQPRVTGDLVWLARVAGGLELLFAQMPDGLRDADEKTIARWQQLLQDPDALLNALLELMKGVSAPGDGEPLWSVHRNRPVELSMRESTATVKADAARTVFDITGRGIRWAVIDTGIDATHVAFRRRQPGGAIYPDAFQPPLDAARTDGHRPPKHLTRVVATYDFTHIRALMAASLRHLDRLPQKLQAKLADADQRAQLQEALERTRGLFRTSGKKAGLIADGRTVDWDVWEPLLRVPHKGIPPYEVPTHPHGTHVAGILAADWRPEDLREDLVRDELGTPRRLVERTGMCPEIELWDVRVSDDGTADEFAVLCALQFLRWRNARHDHLEIHGVNLSISLLHEVSNFACGCTPVCEECERLVASGVVVVAAAGNYGRASYMTTSGAIDEGYRTISITDPGNAPSVITVGATHRANPHTYGVSYFSSRGPTGDGRSKPDLVAPGEKVTSTVPGDSEESLDGTSMAAPHVSGAAALLLCRYPELIGKPLDVKRILCSTATDLERDHNFQGAGLLDTLRALESF